MFDGFIGHWVMLPEENKYESGAAPLEGSYIISIVEGDFLRFHTNWKDVTNHLKSEDYTVKVDGQVYPYEGPYVAEEVQTTRLSANQIETKTFKNGGVISHAVFELLNNGQQLIATQSGALPLGAKFSNHSVYKKEN